MGILDDLLKEIPEEKDPTTPPPAAKAEGQEGADPEKKGWYSDEFKKYAKIS